MIYPTILPNSRTQRNQFMKLVRKTNLVSWCSMGFTFGWHYTFFLKISHKGTSIWNPKEIARNPQFSCNHHIERHQTIWYDTCDRLAPVQSCDEMVQWRQELFPGKLTKQVVVVLPGGCQKSREAVGHDFKPKVREVGKGFQGSGFKQVVVNELCVDKGDMEAQGVENAC